MKKRKVIPFNPGEEFCHEAPMSIELREELLMSVYQKLLLQTFEKYLGGMEDGLREFIEEYNIPQEKSEHVSGNLFWLRMIYETQINQNFDCFQDFVKENKRYFEQYPVLRSWLDEWKKAVPKFYYIGHSFGANAFYATDIETGKMVEIFLPYSTVKAPTRGTIAIATLLPFCGTLYFPLVDFYQFDKMAKKDIIDHLKYYLEELKGEANPYEKFLRIFSTLVKVENLVRENKMTSN